jgi:hypothetical protein
MSGHKDGEPVLEALPSAATPIIGWRCDSSASANRYRADGLGDYEHPHQAIDDAHGYAHLLVILMSISVLE